MSRPARRRRPSGFGPSAAEAGKGRFQTIGGFFGLTGWCPRGGPKISARIKAAAGPCRPRRTDCKVSTIGDARVELLTVVVAVVLAVWAGLIGADAVVDGASGATGRKTGTGSVRGNGGGAGVGRPGCRCRRSRSRSRRGSGGFGRGSTRAGRSMIGRGTGPT